MFAELNIVGLYVFWGFIGMATLAPVLFIGNAYQAVKTPDNYHFRGYYKLKKQHHIRSVRAYGTLAALSSFIIVGYALML